VKSTNSIDVVELLDCISSPTQRKHLNCRTFDKTFFELPQCSELHLVQLAKLFIPLSPLCGLGTFASPFS
jgi:hypothetical protein